MGFLIGIIQTIIWQLLHKIGWPFEALAMVTIGVGFLLTGGLHIDGLMDTADGLAAGKTKCLEAMQDSRVGASGVQAVIIIVLIQISSLIKLGNLAPLAFPIATFWGRCAPLWAINNFSYIHPNGTSLFHKSESKGMEDTFPSLILLVSVLAVLQFTPIKIFSQEHLLMGIVLGIIPALCVPHFLGRKLGGHSGDSYGSSVVIVETIMFFLLAMIL